MQDLTLVGMHDDGERLLLRNADGDRFTLAVDDALRAAVRGDRPRLGQIQLETERMRPRDVQARIRAGQTAEEVAAAGDVPLDYVRRYEGPVLAERAYVASQARRVQIRRGALAAAITPTLGDLVEERLRRREVDPEQSVWDSWRGDDGTWTVQLDFPVGQKRRQARWHYNPPLRQVTPLDDESRWLTDGDGREAKPARRRDDLNGQAADGGRRLSVAPVPSGRAGADDRVPDDRPAPDEQDLLDALVEQESVSSPSLELLDTLRERRGRRIRPVHDADDEGPDPVESAIETILALRNGAGRDAGEPGGTGGTAEPDAAEPVVPAPGRSPSRTPVRQPSPAGGASGRRAAARAAGTGSGRGGSNHPAGRALGRDTERGGPGTGERATDGAGPSSSAGTSSGGSSATGSSATGSSATGSSATGSSAAGSSAAAAKSGAGRRAARVPEPAAPGSPARPDRTPQRRTQRTVEVPPVQSDPAGHDDAGSQVEEPVGAPAARTPARTGTARKNRRASVPSWDEIILGARRD